MKYLTTILIILGLILFACNREAPCTDDGCPSWHENQNQFGVDELTIPPGLDEAIENATETIEELEITPIVHTDTKDEFVYSLNHCITYLYQFVPEEKQIPRELIIAQAALETGWGESRFANEGNNLFGIRTWDKNEPHLLPIPWTKWPGWGVKVFETKCQSVAAYIDIINEVYAYEEFRKVRKEGGTVFEMANTLTKYASKENYTDLVKDVIKHNIRGVYKL
jgi:Bax protein